MSTSSGSVGAPTGPTRLAPGDVVAVLAAVAFMVAWARQALTDPVTFDVGLAYEGGRTALATGHPEALATWISTPFLAVVMAAVSKVMSAGTAADLATVGNLLVVGGLLGAVGYHLRPMLPAWAWRLSLVAMAAYGPMVSSVWWNQFNLPAFGTAVLGFALIRRERPGMGALAISLSLAIKPLVVLLPLALLLRRDTRRAALYVIGIVVLIMLASQGMLAVWAGELRALDPLPALRSFSDKALPANVWACHYENFAPSSTLCRLSGADNWNYVRGVALGGVGLLALLFADLLRGVAGRSWEVFAIAVALSPMISPIAWSHYQLLLAPLLLVIFVRLVRHGGGGPSTWAFLAAGYALTMLMWQPYGTLPGEARQVVHGEVATQAILVGVAGVAQFAQYVVLFAAALLFARRPPAGDAT